MKPWGSRHKVLTWLLVALSVLFMLPGNTAGIIIGLIGLAIAYQLFGRPGIESRSSSQPRTQAPASTLGPRIEPAPPVAKRTGSSVGAARTSRLINELPTPTRIALVNHLEPDEGPEFFIPGGYGGAVIGTDRRLFVIPEGRNGIDRMWAAQYRSLSGARIEQQKNRARLVIGAQDRSAPDTVFQLTGDRQVEAGIEAVQQIRRRIAATQQSQFESPASDGQSAFSETAHRVIPSGRQRASLTLGEMLEMNPTDFEEFTGKALEALGYTNVTRVGGSGDLAADLTAIDPQGRSAIVQCKRYTPGSKVGSPTLQAFIGMKSVHHKAERGIFVTTADYSQQAIDLAREHDIVLIDGDDLVKIAALVLTPPPTKALESTTESVHYCPNCGIKVREGARFCSGCGTDITAYAS